MDGTLEPHARRRWLACRALPGLTWVRSPFRPVRSRPLASELRSRLETAAAALVGAASRSLAVQEWVSPDCRSVPHLLEIVVTSGSERRYIHISKASEKVASVDLQQALPSELLR